MWKPGLEYFAGLIDGEGHIGCQIYSGARRPVIQLQMTCKIAVKAFADYFKINMRELHSPSHELNYAKGYKQMYACRSECRVAYHIIKALRPFLLTKAKAADEALAYYDNRNCLLCGTAIPIERNKRCKYCSKKCQITNKKPPKDCSKGGQIS